MAARWVLTGAIALAGATATAAPVVPAAPAPAAARAQPAARPGMVATFPGVPKSLVLCALLLLALPPLRSLRERVISPDVPPL